MTLSDTAGIMAILETAYPTYYAKRTAQQKGEAVKLWAEMFADDPLDLVGAAVKAIIASDAKFPPNIGEVKARMRSLVDDHPILTEQAAWALVYRACSNGLYAYKQEFEKLPEACQRAVGAPETLHQWAMMDSDTVNSVCASNFMRSYRTVLQRQQDELALPESVKRLLRDARPAVLTEGENDDE